MQYVINPQLRTVGCIANPGHKEANINAHLTDAKLRAIMLVLRNDDEAARRIVQRFQPSDEPLTISLSYGEVLKSGTPIEYAVQIPQSLHAVYGETPVRLHLPDGYADSEWVGEPIVKAYNLALKILGNTNLLPENLDFAQLCKAHMLIHEVIYGKQVPAPQIQFIQPQPAADAAAKPKEARKMQTAQKSKPYVWVTKDGKEIRLTEAQWNFRVKQAGGLDKVPLGSGEIGEEVPATVNQVVLQDDEQVDWEWDDDDLIRVLDVEKIGAFADSLAVEQQPEPEAKAKPVEQPTKPPSREMNVDAIKSLLGV